jgi:hypothetical protein
MAFPAASALFFLASPSKHQETPLRSAPVALELHEALSRVRTSAEKDLHNAKYVKNKWMCARFVQAEKSS